MLTRISAARHAYTGTANLTGTARNALPRGTSRTPAWWKSLTPDRRTADERKFSTNLENTEV
ncbi:unnamed protein product, partial [Nesidiocoris tenuis]